tara:strand:+ start:795 stop:1667 length:873 start_codon:yes stop_codon:yes gene_type:complete
MKKFFILIPVYNDWESLFKLLDEINIVVKSINNVEFNCIVVNDSSSIEAPKFHVPSNIKSIELINMIKNRGHARCNAFGIRYLSTIENYDNVILMDGDGEDRPEEIKLLANKALANENVSVVAKRIKRSEGPFFQLLYQIHKLMTFFFTGKIVNFGNFSCLTKNDIKKISVKESLWSSFSGTLKYHIQELNSINSIRGSRYFGPSKMSLFNLLIHSFSIIAVFKKNVFFRSVILIIIASYFISFAPITISMFQILLVVFNILIYLVSLRENNEQLLNSEKNKKNSIIFSH